jgi:hypothetical protein
MSIHIKILRGGVEREIVYLERDNNMERKEST